MESEKESDSSSPFSYEEEDPLANQLKTILTDNGWPLKEITAVDVYAKIVDATITNLQKIKFFARYGIILIYTYSKKQYIVTLDVYQTVSLTDTKLVFVDFLTRIWRMYIEYSLPGVVFYQVGKEQMKHVHILFLCAEHPFEEESGNILQQKQQHDHQVCKTGRFRPIPGEPRVVYTVLFDESTNKKYIVRGVTRIEKGALDEFASTIGNIHDFNVIRWEDLDCDAPDYGFKAYSKQNVMLLQNEDKNKKAMKVSTKKSGRRKVSVPVSEIVQEEEDV